MSEMSRNSAANEMLVNIAAVMHFAEKQEDSLLAAKLEDVRFTIFDRYLLAK